MGSILSHFGPNSPSPYTSFIHKERVFRLEFVKKLHERVRNHIKVYVLVVIYD